MIEGLFSRISPVAQRHPRSDRLILARYVERAAQDRSLDEAAITSAHEVVVRWAALESSGRLAEIHENQMQGDFLREVFGDALGYRRLTEGADEWQLEQHWTIPDNGTPDAIIGQFRTGERQKPAAVIELKGPNVHLDRDRYNGRTPVQQCWDYLANVPQCRWGIVSNIVSFRLFERNHQPRRYEHFTLQDLRDIRIFRQFYALFSRGGLLPNRLGPGRTPRLLDETDNSQREIGNKLYERYSSERKRLIAHLHYDREYPIDDAIRIAQELIDRIVFIAFCEDRELLPDRTIERAYSQLPPFTKATNPRWRNFLDLFRGVDRGSPHLNLDGGYNGGLFEESEADNLDLDDEWTEFFKCVGDYDFRDEVNLDVLGHLFEKSITEIEKLREGDYVTELTQLTGAREVRQRPSMPQSALRKRMGVYYTPPQFTRYIVERTVDDLIRDRCAAAARDLGLDPETADTPEFWRACLDALRNLKLVDPACGSGAFLFQAYEILESRYGEVIDALAAHGVDDAAELAERIPDFILTDNIHGVDLSPEAVEITQLALWIRSARRGRTLADLSHNIRLGNSLVRDRSVDPLAFDWETEFPDVFRGGEGGFDCVFGNPPWERIKLQEREFFSLSAPEIASATNAAKRRKLIAQLPEENPELSARYEQARERAQKLLDYARQSGQYPLTAKGDINTYAAFAELALKIVAPNGRVGLLVPSGIASDNTTKAFFAALTDERRLIRLHDFENRKGLFPDVHRSFKFSILIFGGRETGQHEASFVFFAHDMDELEERDRHIRLTADDIALLNPNTRTCPIFRTRHDAEITKAIYRRVSILIDRNRERGGNPWGIRFFTMFHQTNDAEHFVEAAWFLSNRYTLEGNQWTKKTRRFLPVYEAKMVQMYDHRAASVITDETNWVRQGQTSETTLVQHQNPEYATLPRFWVRDETVHDLLGDTRPPAFLTFKDVTSPTNTRTMIAAFAPCVGVVNSAPIVFTGLDVRQETCLLANLNSFAFDFVARQKISGIHLNFFIVEQLPTFPPHEYDRACPWEAGITLRDWIAERVLKLTCTAEDMLPLAEACDFTAGNLEDHDGRLHRWDTADRRHLMAELDAAYFILYGIDGEDARYILSTFSGVFDPDPVLPGERSQGEHILNTMDWLLAHIAHA